MDHTPAIQRFQANNAIGFGNGGIHFVGGVNPTVG